MKTTGKITEVFNKGREYEINFIREDRPSVGVCKFQGNMESTIDEIFELAKQGSRIEIETNDHERPQVVGVKIENIQILK